MPRAPITSAVRPSIIGTVSPAPAFTSRIQTQRELADAERRSKQPVLLENEAFPAPVFLNGSRLLSLRTSPQLRTVAAKKNKLLRLGGHDSSPHRVRLRGLARELLHFLATGAAAELQNSKEAPQDRTRETLRADGGPGRRIPDREATLRSLHRDEPDRAVDRERGAGAQLHPQLSAGPRAGALRDRPLQHHASPRAYA